jgi:hypothetical protein
MYLTAYHVDGDPTELTAAYERMLSAFPPDALLFQAFAVSDNGVTIIDACPDKATHAEFVASAGFRDALANAGLPFPRIEVLGDVVHAYAQPAAVTLVGETVTS